jgi:hypothetical protein
MVLSLSTYTCIVCSLFFRDWTLEVCAASQFLLIYNFKFIIWYTNMLFAYHTFLYFIMYLKIHNKIRIMIQQIRIMILDLSQWSTFKNRQGNLFVWSHGFLYLIMYLKIYNKVRFMIQQVSIMIPDSKSTINSQGNSYFRTESR